MLMDKSKYVRLNSCIRGCLQGAEVVLWLEEKLKDCVVAFFGVGTTVEEPGSSTEDHKENKDKAAVKTACLGFTVSQNSCNHLR